MRDIKIDEQYVYIDSQHIYLKRFQSELSDASKLPIILLHESLGSVALWKDFPKQLAQATGHEVIAYDRLGFGLSSALTDSLTADFVWQEAKGAFAAVIQACKLNQFIVLGHSVGGGMALSVAAEYPEHCQAVISVSAQAAVESLTLAGIQAAKVNFQKPELYNRLAKYHMDKTQWVLDAWTETWLAPMFANWNLDEILSRVNCPVQVIHGAKDQYATLAQPERIVAQVCGPVELYILDDCGHFPHQEKTSDMIQLIHKFVANIPPMMHSATPSLHCV